MNLPAQSMVSKSQSVLVVTRNDVRRLLTMDECITAVEEAFRLYGEGAVEPPGVLGTHAASGGFHIKAGILPFKGRFFYAAKTNANFPENRTKHGLPTIQGIVLLFDAECGKPLAIMDSIEITSLRTGAATAVAARYLARRDSSTLSVIGCGMQGRVQIAALLTILQIKRIYAYDIDAAQATAFAKEIAGKSRINVEAVGNFADAARHSDIVVTCTTSKHAFLGLDDIRPGTFIAAVGADSEDKQELDPRLLASNRVVPDVVQQAAAIGELHHALAAGVLKLTSIGGDLGAVVAGRQPARTSDREIIVFDSTGMGLQDVAAACAIYAKAQANTDVMRTEFVTG